MYKNKKIINGKTKKEVINYFYTEFIQKIDYNYFSNCFITSDTNETISMNRFGLVYMLIIKKGNHIVEREYTNGKLTTKKYFLNNNFSCFTGPAYLQVNINGNFTYSYFINGEYYTRKKFNSFVKKTLETINFNRIRNIDKLKQMIPILEYYNRTEQLEALNKRLNCLKIVKELEKIEEVFDENL